MLRIIIWFFFCLSFWFWFDIHRVSKRVRKYRKKVKSSKPALNKDYEDGEMTDCEAAEWLLFYADFNCYDPLKNRKLTPDELKKVNSDKYNLYLAEIIAANALYEKYENEMEA